MSLSRRQFVRGFVAGLVGVALVPRLVDVTAPPKLGPISDADKGRIFAEYLKTAEGRDKLAQAMVEPIRRKLDYTRAARQVFLVEQLPTGGALPIYDKPAEPARSGLLGTLSRLTG